MDKDIAEVAVVQFGDAPQQDGFYVQKVWKQNHSRALVYYYPIDITLEEAKQEIEDLDEFNDGVAIALPLPQHLEELLDKDFKRNLEELLK